MRLKTLALIIDDDRSLLSGTSRILENAGYATIQASNGMDGLRLATGHKPDLILLDVVLPDIDGYEVCRRIKTDAKLADSVVILMSSISTDSESQASGLEIGADGFVARPLSNRELLARLESLLRLKRTEKALKESELKFRTVSDFTYNWEYWIGANGEIRYVSPSCERISGYRREEFLENPKLFYEIVHPEDKERAKDHFVCVGCDEPYTIEFRIVTGGGDVRCIEHSCQPVFGENGEFLGRRVSNRDITKRKQAEETVRQVNDNLERLVTHRTVELLESELMFRSLFENSLDGVFLTLPNGKILLANPAACQILGRTEAEIYDIGIGGICSPDDSCMSLFLETGKRGEKIRREVNLLRKDGFMAPVELTSTIFRHSEDQNRAIISFRDITERKEKEAAIKESRENFLSFLETVEDMIVVSDPDERIIFTNTATSSKLGYTCEELRNMRVLDLHPEKQRDEAEEMFREMFKGQRDVCPLPVVKKNGDYVAVETRVWSGKWSGMDCLFAIAKDLTKEQEALKKFDRIFNFNPASMALTSFPDRKFTDVNEAFLSTLGFSREEVIGKTALDLDLFVERSAHDNVRQKLLDQGSLNGFELAVRKTDGVIIDGLFSGVTIENQDSKCLLTVMTDITEQKKTERQLRLSERAYRTLSENIPGIVYRVHLDEPVRMEFFNSMNNSILGYTEEELKIGEVCPIDPIIAEEDRPGVVESVRSAMAEDRPFEVEYRIRRKNGEIRNLQEYGRPIRNETGEHYCIDGVIFDVTSRKIIENALRQSEKKYRELAELMPQGMFELDSQGRFTFVNPAMSQLSGYGSQELLCDLNIFQLAAHDYREKAAEDFGKIIEQQEHVTGDYVGLKKDGTTFPVLIYAAPMLKQNKVVGLRGLAVDTTPLKQAEQERDDLRTLLFESQKKQAIGTMVGGIAHDFNNMLQAMIGYAELLLDDREEGEREYEFLKTIIQTGQEQAELIRKLLALGEQSPMLTVTMDLNDILKSLSTSLSRTLPQIAHLDLNLTDQSTTIRGDKDQIDQLVNILTENASEAMPEGGTIELATKVVSLDDGHCKSLPGPKTGKFVMLSVKDEGRGIDSKILPRIFDPFFSTKDRGSVRGTGLGLSIVRGIVQQMGGHVTCETELGKGTEFKVFFPCAESAGLSDRGVTTKPG